MTARLYPYALGGLQNGTVDWESLSVRGILMSAGFTYDPTKAYRDELDESFVIAESEIMLNPTNNDGVFTGNALEWLQVSDTRDAYHVVFYDDTGDDPYSPLLAYFGPDDVEGFSHVLNGQNYYLYPVEPPGGFFAVGLNSTIIGALNTYKVAYNLALGETEGGESYTIPVLVFGLDLAVNERICLLPDVLDEDECGPPTIRSSLCG